MRVFVTGISSGIGRELVKNLVTSGHEVRGIARRADALEALYAEVGSTSFSYDCCDVCDIAAMTELSKKMREQQYLPDVVILNAAIDLEDAPPGLDFDQSCQMMRTNYDGAFYWISAFIDTFASRGTGQFIAISSLFARWPDAASISYSASKAALSTAMRGLRIRYARTKIQFKLLYLGPVDTPINPRFSEQDRSQSRIVASAPATANYIIRMMGSNRQDFYFPLYILVVFTFLRWLPDNWFEFLTRPFKR